jgi:hypothetical protein
MLIRAMIPAVTFRLSRSFGARLRASCLGVTAILIGLMSPAGIHAEHTNGQLTVAVTVVRSCSLDTQPRAVALTCSHAGPIVLNTPKAMTILPVARQRAVLLPAPGAPSQILTINF